MNTTNDTNNSEFPIEAKVTSLKSLMNEKYVVPVYQRPYAWEEDQLDDFLTTVFEGYLNGTKNCFFGTMQFNYRSKCYVLMVVLSAWEPCGFV